MTDSDGIVPASLLVQGGPWRAVVVVEVTRTKKGRRTKKKAAVLERHRVGDTPLRIKHEPPGHLYDLKRLADRLNGWEAARDFPPGKRDLWRVQNHLPAGDP